MALWDDEFEALRPQLARGGGGVHRIHAVARRRDGRTLSVEERVAAHRADPSSAVPPSDRAVDRTIDGPAGPIRLRTFTHEQPDGVLFHIHGGAWMAAHRR